MKKSPASKRTVLPHKIEYTKTFLKDWERLLRSGRYDIKKMKRVMLMLIANDEPLGPEWEDHPLKGKLQGYRECHIGGDFLLIYNIDEKISQGGMIYFTRAGTHSELFK